MWEMQEMQVWSGRSPAEGNGSPLQYSCLENSTDGRVWWATVHGVSKNRTKPRHWAHTLDWPKNAFEFFHNMLQKNLAALFGQLNVRGKSVPKKVSWEEYPWLRALWQRNKKEIKKRVKETEGFFVDKTDASGHWVWAVTPAYRFRTWLTPFHSQIVL